MICDVDVHEMLYGSLFLLGKLTYPRYTHPGYGHNLNIPRCGVHIRFSVQDAPDIDMRSSISYSIFRIWNSIADSSLESLPNGQHILVGHWLANG